MCYICKAEKVDYTHFYGQVTMIPSFDTYLVLMVLHAGR